MSAEFILSDLQTRVIIHEVTFFRCSLKRRPKYLFELFEDAKDILVGGLITGKNILFRVIDIFFFFYFTQLYVFFPRV